jgi:zinc transport system permease protein
MQDADELAEIEAALAADAGFDHAHEDHHDDHAHEDHHLDIEDADAAPTWDEFWDSWELFREPVYAAGIAGLVLGLLSVYIVLRRMVFVSAAITQGAGFGVAASFYVAVRFGWSIDPVWGATAMSLATAALVAPDPRRLGLSREMVLGLAFALFSGGAVLASARIPDEAHDLQAILFGTAVVVSTEELHRLAISGAAILGVQLWWFRGFAFASFDPLAARVQGLPVRLLDVLLLVSIGVMVGEAARALGALPAFALSVLPGVAAVQLARGPLIVTFAVAAVLGATAGMAGYVAAFLLDLPVGATQTALAGGFVVAATAVRGLGLALGAARR